MLFDSHRLVMWYHQSPPKIRMKRAIPHTGLKKPTTKQMSIPTKTAIGSYRFRQSHIPLGVIFQSCWMIWFGGRDGTGIGLTGAVCAGGTYTGGLWLNCGGGDCGTVKWGGGGNTYPWAEATVAAHKKIDAIATRIKSLLCLEFNAETAHFDNAEGAIL